MFGLGCFWGAERAFWTLPGVYSTAVGYAGGLTPNPTYEEVCTGRTGHNEVVRVVYDPARVSFELYRADGTLLGTDSVVLMPWSNDQINRIFDPYHPVTGWLNQALVHLPFVSWIPSQQ